ncbi:MAG: hypothetical protein ACLVG5_02210 [Clostridium sp.]
MKKMKSGFVRAVYKNGKVSFPQDFSSGAIGTLRGCNCLLDIPAGGKCKSRRAGGCMDAIKRTENLLLQQSAE